MTNAVILVGAPGSGKSTLAKQMHNHLTQKGKTCLVISSDEIRNEMDLDPANSDHQRVVWTKVYKKISEANQNWIIIDATNTNSVNRKKLVEHCEQSGCYEIVCFVVDAWLDYCLDCQDWRSKSEGHFPVPMSYVRHSFQALHQNKPKKDEGFKWVVWLTPQFIKDGKPVGEFVTFAIDK